MPHARNDSALVTGLSSAFDRKRFEKQQALHERKAAEKEDMQAKLGSMSQRGQVILDWIKEEKRAAGDMTSVIMNLDTEENVRAQFMARKMHLEFLTKAEARVKKYLKEPKE